MDLKKLSKIADDRLKCLETMSVGEIADDRAVPEKWFKTVQAVIVLQKNMACLEMEEFWQVLLNNASLIVRAALLTHNILISPGLLNILTTDHDLAFDIERKIGFMNDSANIVEEIRADMRQLVLAALPSLN